MLNQQQPPNMMLNQDPNNMSQGINLEQGLNRSVSNQPVTPTPPNSMQFHGTPPHNRNGFNNNMEMSAGKMSNRRSDHSNRSGNRNNTQFCARSGNREDAFVPHDPMQSGGMQLSKEESERQRAQLLKGMQEK